MRLREIYDVGLVLIRGIGACRIDLPRVLLRCYCLSLEIEFLMLVPLLAGRQPTWRS